jgi:geranylgeranyl diphosphate synthase type II
LSEVGVSDSKRVRMLAVAARGHNDLCVGQGKELTWMSDPKPLLESEVIDIFKKKTSPAFAVALKVGAIFAGTDDATLAALDSYSVSLGIAYQIRDDLQDFSFGEDSGDLDAMRPSLLLAMTYQQATGDDKKLIESVWNRSVQFKDAKSRIQDAIARLSIRQKAFATMESYKGRAIESIASLKSAPLKGLLRRVIYKIFNDVNVMDCCNDYTAGTG